MTTGHPGRRCPKVKDLARAKSEALVNNTCKPKKLKRVMLNGEGNENGIFLCRSFAQLQRCFVRLKRQTSLIHVIFMEELSYVLTQYFVSCVHVRFYFSLPLIFTLLAANI